MRLGIIFNVLDIKISLKTKIYFLFKSHYTFRDVHIDGARNIARVCREAHVGKLIHFSSLNASPTPQKIYFKPSQFLISKVDSYDSI